MSMTESMCVSMTGRPTRAQIANEQRRQSYGYLQNAKAKASEEDDFDEFMSRANHLACDVVPIKGYDY
jgi:hypothetical protein